MRIAIVGPSRLTENEELDVRQFCGMMINQWKFEYGNELRIISGGARGVDTIAVECAKQLGVKTMIFYPDIEKWDDEGCLLGYKSRNKNIVQNCDEIWCLTVSVRKTPCYHCNDKENPHERSGACWTAREAGKNGKEFRILPPTR